MNSVLRKYLLRDSLIIEFSEPVKALSSTVLNGGLKKLTHVVFHRVSEDFNEPNPKSYATKLVKNLGLPVRSTAVFLTSVDIINNHIDKLINEPEKIRIIATIGLKPLVCMDEVGGNSESYSTINILIVVWGKCLSDNALIDVASVTTSAKTLALIDLGLSCGYAGRPYSTATDALVIASKSKDAYETPYGGPLTSIGHSVARVVYKTLIEYGLRSLDLDARFKHILGVSIDEFIDTTIELYRNAAIPGIPISDVRENVRDELLKLLDDPNTWSIVLSAKSLDYYGLAGTIPNLAREEYLSDSKKILADELLGITLSLYINGWKALFSYYWVDRIKNKLNLFKDKPMFMDDILASLSASVLSKVYDRYLTREE